MSAVKFSSGVAVCLLLLPGRPYSSPTAMPAEPGAADCLHLAEPSEPAVVWTNSASGVGNPSNGALLATDGLGNVYLAAGTGYSDSDFQLLKFDAGGNRLWRSTHDGPGAGYDEPVSLAVDHTGNAYVAGYATPSGSDRDFLTVKFDPSGQFVWARQLGAERKADLPAGVALDPEGSITVAGTRDSDGQAAVAVVQYSPDGAPRWEGWFQRGFRTHAKGLAVDAEGNTYVIAVSYGGQNDWTVLKFTPQGGRAWDWHYDGQAHYDDQPDALAIDAQGNLLVSGTTATADGFDYLTVKFSPAGTVLWTARQPNSAPGYGRVRLDADSDSQVYVLAETVDEETILARVLKYDADGERLWQACLAGPWSTTTPFAADPAGGCFANVALGRAGQVRLALIRFDTDGTLQWQAEYGRLSAWQHPTALARDPAGTVYVGGLTPGEFRLAAYSESPAPDKPRLDQRPVDRAVPAGAEASFTVSPCGDGPFAYQWKRDGLPVEGATDRTLRIARVMPWDAGCYAVVVSHESGAVESPAAQLTVLPPEDVFVITMGYSQQTGFNLLLIAPPGSDYTIECTTDFARWEPVKTVYNGTGVMFLTHPEAMHSSQCFYRALKLDEL